MESKYPESGAALKRARHGKISQERLAAKVGTTRRHMIRLENGENRPSVQLRDRIADALEVPRETLPAAEEEDDEALPMRLDEALLLQAMAAALTHAANRTKAAA